MLSRKTPGSNARRLRAVVEASGARGGVPGGAARKGSGVAMWACLI